MNPKARTECVEVLFNPAELDLLDLVRNGLARSTFLRNLSNEAARRNGSPPDRPKESRACPGMRPATRAAAGGAHRPLRV
jgi:hypothetical protein